MKNAQCKEGIVMCYNKSYAGQYAGPFYHRPPKNAGSTVLVHTLFTGFQTIAGGHYFLLKELKPPKEEDSRKAYAYDLQTALERFAAVGSDLLLYQYQRYNIEHRHANEEGHMQGL